ncbi:pyridoxine biosynthesis transcriptional regulator PdxR [Acrocarpospora macrocephala]|uniref:HTH-type pyridoxine biosynthesis transcriptional regulator PdxR n=1 Tax=Acrocarpospora macrocephala TaxID=150177 RepID=A0A5M3X1J7_9ACTN|nr:PLP-dependent aminotransferase family protein [Acrocarpospora macrocephala]GES14870.1 HTH-type pyridoxine biosynthesis transcriptional regulator PdxR [Acrocarpospora macrocephala]
MRQPQRLSVPLLLDRDQAPPLQEQLLTQLKAAIDSGRLATGTRMPSTRALARILKVSRGVVVGTYDALYADGYITGVVGSGTYVAKDSLDAARTAPASGRPGPAPAIDLRPDRPSSDCFPLPAWRAAWRTVSYIAPGVAEAPPLGLPELRAAIAGHLLQARGIVLDRHEVVVTSSQDSALRLVLSALGEDPVIALECPALPMARTVAARQGRVSSVPVDDQGVRLDLMRGDWDAAVLTPERNPLLGARLSLERRRALAEDARTRGSLLIEPALGGVLDLDVSPLPPLMSLARAEHAALIGSFGAVLTPALHLGFAVVESGLAETIAKADPAHYEQPSPLVQLAVSDLLASGGMAAHLTRLAGRHAALWRLVWQALGDLPGTRLLRAGGTATLLLPDEVCAKRVVRALAVQRIHLTELDSYVHPRSPALNGLVIGFGHLGEAVLGTTLRVIRRTVSAARE